LEVFSMIFVADNHSAEVEEPGKEPFDLPAPDVASQGPSVLGGDFAVALVGRDHLRAVVVEELFIQPVAIVSLSPIKRSGTSATKRSSMVFSTSFTSAGEALSVRRARGRPERSAIPMILVPLPRLVFPTCRPLFWPEQTFRPRSIPSNPIPRRLGGVWPRLKAVVPSPRNAPSSGSAGGPSGAARIVRAGLSTGLRFAISTTCRSARCVGRSTGGPVHLPAPGLPVGCS